jgi:hypothetical protein
MNGRKNKKIGTICFYMETGVIREVNGHGRVSSTNIMGMFGFRGTGGSSFSGGISSVSTVNGIDSFETQECDEICFF